MFSWVLFGLLNQLLMHQVCQVFFFQFADTDTVPAEPYMIVNQHFILL